MGVFGVAIATVILPNLSRQFASEDDGFSITLDWAMRMVLLIAVPSALALVIIAKPVLFTLFQYGEMSVFDIHMSSLSLRAYVLGLCAFMLIKVLASAYFSRQDTRTPVKVGVIAMVSNMGLNLLFVLPLLYLWNIGHVGLAMATTASAYLNAFLLYRGLVKRGIYSPTPGWLKFCLQLGAASGVMVGVLLLVLSTQLDYGTLAAGTRVLQLVVLVGAGVVTYVILLLAVGLRPSDLRHHA